MFPFRMFSSLAKGLAGGVVGLDRYLTKMAYDSRQANRFGPYWKEKEEMDMASAAMDLQLDQANYEGKLLENESKRMGLEKDESEAILKSGGLRAGETFSKSRYRGLPVGGGDENPFELRPVSRAEAMAEAEFDRGRAEERKAREKMLYDRERDRLTDDLKRSAELRAEKSEERAERTDARAARTEARLGAESSLRQGELRQRVAKAEFELEQARSGKPGTSKIPAGMFDDQVLNELRRLDPSVEEVLAEETLDSSGRVPKITDYSPDLVDQAIANVHERATVPPERRKPAVEEKRKPSGEPPVPPEMRRTVVPKPAAPQVTEPEEVDDAEVEFQRDPAIEDSILSKDASQRTPEEREYLRKLALARRGGL